MFVYHEEITESHHPPPLNPPGVPKTLIRHKIMLCYTNIYFSSFIIFFVTMGKVCF